jgi:hypothetical protein
MVAFPQRRGRGKSEGLYDEGFNVDRNQGCARDPQLSLPGADRALTDIAAAVEVLLQRPDVARRAILMVGFSRDGILSIAYAGMHPRDSRRRDQLRGRLDGRRNPERERGQRHAVQARRDVPASDLVALRQPRHLLQPRPQPRELCRVPGGGWQGLVLRLRGAGRERAQGDVFPAPLDRPRPISTRSARRRNNSGTLEPMASGLTGSTNSLQDRRTHLRTTGSGQFGHRQPVHGPVPELRLPPRSRPYSRSCFERQLGASYRHDGQESYTVLHRG